MKMQHPSKSSAALVAQDDAAAAELQAGNKSNLFS